MAHRSQEWLEHEAKAIDGLASDLLTFAVGFTNMPPAPKCIEEAHCLTSIMKSRIRLIEDLLIYAHYITEHEE